MSIRTENSRHCSQCAHPADEHDESGGCRHPDRRTKSGLCAGHYAYTGASS